MELKTKVVTAFHVDCGDLEGFIEHHYSGSVSIPAIQESSNDVTLEAGVTGLIHEYDKGDAKMIRKGEYPLYSMHTILDCLCQDGFIEKGNYLISISW